MNKNPEIKFTEQSGVYTNADTADLPEQALTELKNMRSLPGKLVKTYGAGYLQDDDANVCPITVAKGYSVINIFCYINENLDDDRAYIAIIQNDSSQQIWILQFDSDYNVASREPSVLLPFGADSFWVKGDAQTFNDYGRLMLTNVTVTNNVGGVDYDFPTSFAAHMPQSIDDTDAADSIAYGGMPTELGVSIELGVSMYREGDAEIAYFEDTVAFDNETIATFDNSSPNWNMGIHRILEVGDKVFAIVPGKSTAAAPDRLFWYDSGAWTEIARANYGVSGWDSSNDHLTLFHLAKMGGDLYLMYLHYDDSDTGSEYHYRMSRLHSILTTPTWVNRLVENDQAEYITNSFTGLPQDDVTSATYSSGGVDYIFVHYNGDSTGTTVCPGTTIRYSVSGGLVGVDTPAWGDTNARDTVGIAIADGQIYMFADETASSLLEFYVGESALSPSWKAKETLPTTINGLGAGFTWKSGKFVVSSKDSSGDETELAIMANIDDGTSYWSLLRYNAKNKEWLGHTSYKYATATYSIYSLYFSNQEGLTGYQYLSNRVDISGSFASTIIVSSTALVSNILYTGTAGTRYYAIASYESSLTADHLTSVHFLFGQTNPAGSADPTIDRVVSFGANPDFTAYAGDIKYNATFGACMGWVELFQGLDVDQDQDLYHKADKNPIVMENGIIRFLPGAVGEVEYPADTFNEAKGLWIGYINRNFYDGLYSPTAAFYAYDKTPLTPEAYTNTNTVATDVALDGWGAEDTYRYVRYSFIYDGVNESLLSPPIYTKIDDTVDKAIFRLKLFDGTAGDVRDNYRITGMNIYQMTSASDSAVATLIRQINFTLKAADRTNYSANGQGRLVAWIDDDTIGPLAPTSGVVSAISNAGAAAIRATTSVAHGLIAGWAVTIAGTTDYNGSYIITNVSDTTHFDVTDAYVSSQTGTWSHSDYFGKADSDSEYTAITAVEDLGDDGFLITTGTPQDTTAFNGAWYLSHSGETDSDYDGGTENGYFEGATTGEAVIIDTTVDFEGLSPIGLTVASTNTTGTQAITADAATDDFLIVNGVAKHAIQIDANSNTVQDFKYHIASQPYVFYTNATYYSLFAILDFVNEDGSAYGLQGAKYIKVNGDFALVISNRLWQVRNILDPGGENEEQFDTAAYSEINQYDVNPVDNIIKINDREGGGGTGLADLFGRPVIAFNQGLFLIDSKTVPDDPDDWTISESVHNIGNIAKHGMVTAIGNVYVIYYDGIYALNANNLAETDKTPTERLKISTPIGDTFEALTTTQKKAIVGEYDQSRNEILWTLGDEQWAYSTVYETWREIDQSPDIDIITLDENADLMFYDEADDSVRSFTTKLAVVSSMKTKVYQIAIERDELLRYIWVFNPYDDIMTVSPYIDGDAVSVLPTTIAADTAKQKVVVKKRGLQLQVKVNWASSTNDNQILRIGLEYDN